MLLAITILITIVTTSLLIAMVGAEFMTKGGLASADPVHIVCRAQIIFTVLLIVVLLIIGG